MQGRERHQWLTRKEPRGAPSRGGASGKSPLTAQRQPALAGSCRGLPWAETARSPSARPGPTHPLPAPPGPHPPPPLPAVGTLNHGYRHRGRSIQMCSSRPLVCQNTSPYAVLPAPTLDVPRACGYSAVLPRGVLPPWLSILPDTSTSTSCSPGRREAPRGGRRSPHPPGPPSGGGGVPFRAASTGGTAALPEHGTQPCTQPN